MKLQAQCLICKPFSSYGLILLVLGLVLRRTMTNYLPLEQNSEIVMKLPYPLLTSRCD